MPRIKGAARGVAPTFRSSPELSLTIPINPLPTPRPRVTTKPFVNTYYPTNYKNWRKDVAEYLETQPIPRKFTGQLIVAVTLAVKQPKKSKLTHPKPDIDNFAKAVLDAMTRAEGVWDDDEQVVSLLAYKRWAKRKEEPHLQVDIWEIEEDTRCNP